MKLSHAPFHITLISGGLPLVAAFLDNKFIVYLPFMLAGMAFIWYLFQNQMKISKVGGWAAALFLFLLFHGIGTSVTVGHGSLGLLGLVLVTMIYVKLLSGIGNKPNPDTFTSQLIIIYMLHITYLFFELLMRMAGFQDLLLSLFGSVSNSEVAMLKTYNTASFLWFLGFPRDFFGLSGMLLGSQSAGQVMASAFIVSALWYKYSPLKGLKHWIFSLIALFAFACAVNMTMLLTLVVVCLLMIYVVPFSGIKKTALQLIVPLGVMFFFSALASLLLYRIEDYDLDTAIYMEAFSAPIRSFPDFTLWEFMFGLGRSEVRADAADFGLGMLASQVGFVFMIVVGLVLGNILISALRETRRVASWGASLSLTEKKWLWLATVNALISFVFAMGLVHYTPSIELGGLQMFAFSIALTIISVRNLRSFKRPGY